MTNASSPATVDATQAEDGAGAPAARTPNTDMQADDAGTADSGVESGTGTSAESAMKQTSKTAAETGSQR